MKYVKAKIIFPESLLAEIQKYVHGQLIYIPRSQAQRKKWGSNTGAMNTLAKRNENIVEAFKEGTSIPQLAALHNLAEDTIKKIVYGRQ